MAKTKSDCVDPEGHVYVLSGHVARCQHPKCNKTQTFNPVTRKWEDAKK